MQPRFPSRRLSTRKSGTAFRMLPGGPAPTMAQAPRTNLLLQSQAFDNASWQKIGNVLAAPSNVSTNTVIAPDGTATAERYSFPVSAGAGWTFLAQNINPTPVGVHSWSVWLKASTGTATIYLSVTADGVTYFTTACALTTTWQRFTLQNKSIGTAGLNYYMQIGYDSRDGAESNIAAQSVDLWAAQWELAATATDYIPTTTAAASWPVPQGSFGEVITVTRASSASHIDANGLVSTVPANQGRIQPAGLLVEPARTNLILRSEAFDHSYWVPASSTITANSTVAPDGATTAETVTAAAANAVHGLAHVGNNFATVTASTYVASVFAKAGTVGWLKIREAANTGAYATFNLSTGAAGTAGTGGTGSIKAIGSGWYRCSMTWAAGNTSSLIQFAIADSQANALANTSWAAAGTETVILWGGSAELGANASSYIATTSSTVTRAADAVSTPTSAAWPVVAGEVALDYTPLMAHAATTSYVLVDARSTAANDPGWLFAIYDTGLYFSSFTSAGGVGAVVGTGLSWTLGQTYRLRFVWGGGTATLYRDDVSVGSGSSPAPDAINATGYLGSDLNGALQINGSISNLAVRAV